MQKMNRELTEKEALLVFMRFDRLGKGRVGEQEFVQELEPSYR